MSSRGSAEGALPKVAAPLPRVIQYAERQKQSGRLA